MINQNYCKMFRPELHARKCEQAAKRAEKRKADCV
eukprot:gene5131-20863_t